MKSKSTISIILSLIFIVFAAKISLAEVNISKIPKPEQIQSFIPQPLTDLFKTFSNINIDFSKLNFLNQAAGAIPKSGQQVASGFQWLTNGLTNINNWLIGHIGLNIVLVVKKVGEFFVWVFNGIAHLIQSGLSFIH